MNENAWAQLIQNTVFLSPATVERFAEEYGDAAVMPVAFRGIPSDGAVPHNNGYPVPHGGAWYSLWGMRPSRDACSLALGLKRRDLENVSRRPVACTNGTTVEKVWRVHHVYECGLSASSVVHRAACFTNLANLVLVSREYHEIQRSFIHGAGHGGEWLKWIISVLYPKASRGLGPLVSQPDGSPDIARVNVAIENSEAYADLKNAREQRPAGSDIATRRWKDAQTGISQNVIPVTKSVSEQQVRKPADPVTPAAGGWMSPNEVTDELKRRGYIARQNSQSQSLYLNLGGKKSELNRSDFRGVVLFYPNNHLMFGVVPAEVTEFRELVMERIGQREWRRREGVPGPTQELNRVAVNVFLSQVGEPGMICRVNGADIRFDGYAETLRFQKGRCEWRDVEAFLKNLDRFCLQVS